MDYNTFLAELNTEYWKDIVGKNPRVEVYDVNGNKFKIDHIYSDEGVICIDVEKEQQ